VRIERGERGDEENGAIEGAGAIESIAPAVSNQGRTGNVVCAPRRFVLSKGAFCDLVG